MIDRAGPGIPISQREVAMIPGQSMVLGAVAASPNGTAPRCEHLDGLTPIGPQSEICLDCRRREDRQASLVVCLTCGWVACSDDSPNQHAKAHYEETDHPVTATIAPGVAGRWCYVHQRLV
jgi:Zn-finger in ubiquitin-hydrolases and other protein